MGKYLPNLRLLRKEKHITSQEKLLEAFDGHLGITVRTYGKYERGEEPIPSDVAIMLADFFGVSVDFLLGRSDCRSVDNEYIRRETRLSDDSIQQLKIWAKFNLHPAMALNAILSHDLKRQRDGKDFELHLYNAMEYLYKIMTPPAECTTKEKDPDLYFQKLYFELKSIQQELPPRIQRVKDPELAAAVLQAPSEPFIPVFDSRDSCPDFDTPPAFDSHGQPFGK